MSNKDVLAYHEAIRKYDEDPSKQNADKLEASRRAYEEQKHSQVLAAKERMSSTVKEVQASVKEETKSKVAGKEDRVKSLLRRAYKEYEIAIEMNRELRDALKANVQHKADLRAAIESLRKLKKRVKK